MTPAPKAEPKVQGYKPPPAKPGTSKIPPKAAATAAEASSSSSSGAPAVAVAPAPAPAPVAPADPAMAEATELSQDMPGFFQAGLGLGFCGVVHTHDMYVTVREETLGKAVIDCGATASIGSVEALEALIELRGGAGIRVNPSHKKKPTGLATEQPELPAPELT